MSSVVVGVTEKIVRVRTETIKITGNETHEGLVHALQVKKGDDFLGGDVERLTDEYFPLMVKQPEEREIVFVRLPEPLTDASVIEAALDGIGLQPAGWFEHMLYQIQCDWWSRDADEGPIWFLGSELRSYYEGDRGAMKEYGKWPIIPTGGRPQLLFFLHGKSNGAFPGIIATIAKTPEREKELTCRIYGDWEVQRRIR